MQQLREQIEAARLAVAQIDHEVTRFSNLKRQAPSAAGRIAYKLELERVQEEKTKRMIILANLLLDMQLEAAI